MFSHLCFSRFNGHWSALCILGYKQPSTLIPHSRLASCRVWYSSFRVPMTPEPSYRGMPCRHHGPARCRVDSKRDLSAPPLSDLTPTAGQTDSMLCPINLSRTQVSCQFLFPNVVTTRRLALDPISAPICVPTCVQKMCDNPSYCSASNFCTKFS